MFNGKNIFELSGENFVVDIPHGIDYKNECRCMWHFTPHIDSAIRCNDALYYFIFLPNRIVPK